MVVSEISVTLTHLSEYEYTEHCGHGHMLPMDLSGDGTTGAVPNMFGLFFRHNFRESPHTILPVSYGTNIPTSIGS